ncbi:MAG TPA: glycosyltransferase [Rhizomicrobium sp.]
MLGSGFGGLEKLFLDEIEMLENMGARGVVRRGSPLARYSADRHLPFEEMRALSDWDPISLYAARSIVKRHRPRLVLCVGRKAHRLFGRAVGRSIPIVVMLQKRRFDLGFPHAGVLVAARHRETTLVEDGVAPRDIVVIPNAVRLPPRPKTDFALKDGMPAHIAALGRLHPKKGYGVLIEALRLLAERGTSFRCTIAGEGPEREKLLAQIRDGGLSDRVSLPGWTDDVANYLAAADLFVLPSFQEDFPLAVLDAMAAGLPIVASAIDGPKDFLVDGETGMLVPPNDPTALADQLARVLASQPLRARTGTAARRAAEQSYSFQTIGRRLTTALENVIAGRPISAA